MKIFITLTGKKKNCFQSLHCKKFQDSDLKVRLCRKVLNINILVLVTYHHADLLGFNVFTSENSLAILSTAGHN